jgi:hypothetical protein
MREMAALFFGHRENLPLLVIPAVRAGAVRKPPLATVRALRERGCGQMIVGAPAVAPTLGMTPFRIWHGC